MFFTGEHSRKARNLAADPRLAISIVDRILPRPAASSPLRSHKDTGEPFAVRDMSVFVLEPE